MTSTDTVQLKIIKVNPDSFPLVSIVFEAVKDEMPIFGLEKDKLLVTENDVPCEIVSLQDVSQQYPISITLVLDHSGSMQQNVGFYLNDSTGQREALSKQELAAIKAEAKTPLDNAKAAMIEFMKVFASSKDSIQIVGFSTTVDVISKFSNDSKYLDSITNSINIDSITAFTDALDIALNELKDKSGIRVIVALTDGLDNASHVTDKAVIKRAQKLKIPIYTIGLGNVNKYFLRNISRETNGAFYYTRESNSLTKVYQEIQNRIKSIYDLRYASKNLRSNDTIRRVKIEFTVDSAYLTNNLVRMNLPKETVNYLKAKETRKKQRTALFVVIGTVAGLGIVIYTYRKKKRK